MEIDEQNSLN